MTWDDPPTVAGRYWWHGPPTARSCEGAGPTRVVNDQPDETFKPRPVGFAPTGRHRRAVETDAPSTATRYWYALPGTCVLRIAPPPGVHRRSP